MNHLSQEHISESSIARAIGFDFGLTYVGIAIGQTLTRTARAITTLSAKQGSPNWNTVKRLIQTWQPNVCVVGMPLNMDGTKQPLTDAVSYFSSELAHRFKLPIYTMDERLSTVEARSHLFARGGYKALKKNAIDKTAAQLILESWLQYYCVY